MYNNTFKINHNGSEVYGELSKSGWVVFVNDSQLPGVFQEKSEAVRLGKLFVDTGEVGEEVIKPVKWW